MSGLHMIELWPQEAQLLHFLQGQGMNDTGDEDLGYGMHAWLKAAFGAFAPKPFRILSKHGRPLRLLGLQFPCRLQMDAQAFAHA